ncbi:DUF2653 family protein [Heyndrickxia acidicola]|uniref:DUF2653 family protein n=1 Tax=Heyndrickxia acidicola TaxID=209389 RepID=A0ABU6MAX0_9BACI|nr:DUF2653 family protein [Heyndrickxia acidicola]MED1201818.1 DUF2653 family protein [Heyndrickxia acidicola]
MEIRFNEQDLIDSVCVYTAEQQNMDPEYVEVDLEFNQSYGVAATAIAHGRTYRFNEQDVIDAVAVYLQSYHNFAPDRLLVDLSFEEREGIGASIIVR